VIVSYAKRPVACVTASLTALTLGAAYMLPGYVGWAIPSAALDHTSRVSRIAAAEGVLLVAAYKVFRHPFGGLIGHTLTAVATIGAPLGVLSGLGMLLLDGRRVQVPSRS
jgi:predicted benzoate:H+ symporter BenE